MKLCFPLDPPGLARLRAHAALLLLMTAAPALAAQERTPAVPQQGVSVSTPHVETGRRRLSKYESRKIRHACAARAAERGLSGAERENYLSGCYINRLAHRGERQRCRQEAAAKGIDKSALRDFLRECVKERSHE